MLPDHGERVVVHPSIHVIPRKVPRPKELAGRIFTQEKHARIEASFLKSYDFFRNDTLLEPDIYRLMGQ